MTIDDIEGTGTATDPWQLTTPPGNSEFEAYRDPEASPPALVVQVGKTQLRYHLSCIGRSDANPVGGWYGIKKGLRGRFGNYLPPVLEALGLAEVEHNPRNNRMRAI